MDGFGVIAALASYDDVHFGEFGDVVGIQQGFVGLPEIGGGTAHVGCGEEMGFGDVGEVVFFAHALHEYGADHAAPADKSYFHVCLLIYGVDGKGGVLIVC